MELQTAQTIQPGNRIPFHPSPLDFDRYLPWACAQLSVEAMIVIIRKVKTEYVSSASDRTKSKPKEKQRTPSTVETGSEISESKEDTSILAGIGNEDKIYVETIYDSNLNLVQLKFLKNSAIPRQIMKIIGLIIPFHHSLNSITIDSGLHMEAMYEISKLLHISRITELNLDHTFLIEANYHVLLDQNSLKHLSLAKCQINDAVVKMIACKLVYPYPASKKLSVLNLATNRITDIGVKYLADVLRTNRQLSYLNLADNLITDKGATSIFENLVEFTLTAQEMSERKARYVTYLKEKIELVKKMAKEVRIGEFDKKATRRKSQKSAVLHAVKKIKTIDNASSIVNSKSISSVEAINHEKAEAIVQSTLGPFQDPFDPSNTELRDDVVYCFGNNTLCYLNLAYNNLSYCSLKKLNGVLLTQRILSRKPKGLINVMIEGNYLPEFCDELLAIDDLLETGLSAIRKLSVSKKKPAPRVSTK